MCVMKLNKYFMIGAMGLSLVACSDNLDENGQGANGTNPNEGTTYAALKIDFGSSSSRATGDLPSGNDQGTTDPTYDDDETTPDNETDINDVRIIVTNEDGVVEFNDVVTKQDKQDYFLIAIQPGVKNFYAIVNGESHDLTEPTTWGEKVLAQIASEDKVVNVKASNLSDYSSTPGEGKGFVMSSVAAVPQRIYDNVTEAEAQAGPRNRVNITVDRMVAKVTVKLADALVTSGFDEENFALKSLSAQIMNADNVKYVDPDSDPTYEGTYWMAYNDNNVRKTPYYGYVPSIEVPEDGLASGSAQPLYASTGATKNPVGRFYCLENTHASTDYKQANTTYLKLEATMVPNNLVTFGKTDNNITVTDKEYSGDPKTFYVINGYDGDGAEKVYCVLAEDLANAYTTIVTGGSETENDAKITAVIAELGKAGYQVDDLYQDGKGTYRIPVNDINNGKEYLNIQPVFRNDWYDIEIQGIELPGDPAGEGFDPDQPFHQSTSVATVVTVRKWNKVSHGVVLE